MMPGRTKKVRLALRNKFAVDISKRCHAVFKSVHTQEKGNFKRLTKRINKCIFAVKGCYTGNHRQCKSAMVKSLTTGYLKVQFCQKGSRLTPRIKKMQPHYFNL